MIDKPVGPTSFQIVQRIRRALRMKKVGHAGTLDPFASGLLVVCAGRPATKLIDRLMAGEKEYEAVLKLGVETDTQDLEGKVVAEQPVPDLSKEQVESCLATFLGDQLQHPPQYSALKHKGKPLYYYARKGVSIEKPPRPITIHELELLELGGDTLSLRVVCSKGTYIRTLAHDIGGKLGCGAHLIVLRRTRSGNFKVANAVNGTLLEDPAQGRDALMAQDYAIERFLDDLPQGKESTE